MRTSTLLLENNSNVWIKITLPSDKAKKTNWQTIRSSIFYLNSKNYPIGNVVCVCVPVGVILSSCSTRHISETKASFLSYKWPQLSKPLSKLFSKLEFLVNINIPVLLSKDGE